MTSKMTNAERQADFRRRHREAGVCYVCKQPLPRETPPMATGGQPRDESHASSVVTRPKPNVC